MSPERSQYQVSFAPQSHDPVSLVRGAVLSEHLNVCNSPVLFGCRTGICGTCLIEVLAQDNGEIAAPSTGERELLELVAPDNPLARLACQIELCADIRIKYIGK